MGAKQHRRGMAQRFLDGFPLATPWRPITTAGATITLNGGTVVDLGAGAMRVTVPGGAATLHPKDGVLLRYPLLQTDGKQAVGRTAMNSIIRCVEAGTIPGLSSDTLVRALISDGTDLATANWIGGGLDYTGAARHARREKGVAGTASYADQATTSGLAVGWEHRALYAPKSSAIWVRYHGTAPIKLSGVEYIEGFANANIYEPNVNLDANKLYLFLSVGRSAPTAGIETVDIKLSTLITPQPR